MTCGLYWLHNNLKWLYLDKQYQCTVPLSAFTKITYQASIDHKHMWFYASLISINIYGVGYNYIFYFHRKIVTKNLLEKQAFFEISENKNPSGITWLYDIWLDLYFIVLIALYQ